MTIGRVIPHRLPVCPGRDSLYSVRSNHDQPGAPWWVHYRPPDGDFIPADQPHEELVALVNALKEQMGNAPGGRFSINEHSQVIAHTTDPSGEANTVHVVNVAEGRVATYREVITFNCTFRESLTLDRDPQQAFQQAA